MIQKIKNLNISHKAFTLIEMVIVLIIMWIMLMFTVSLSGDQIQKVKDKAIKESILAEMQTRYSRNLWSSSFAWEMYDTMEVKFAEWDKIDFKYNLKEWEPIENSFSNHFKITYLGKNYNPNNEKPTPNESITLTYSPYQISCKIWEEWEDWADNLIIVTRVNDSRDYCFEINSKNCRLIEMSDEENCKTLAPSNNK